MSVRSLPSWRREPTSSMCCMRVDSASTCSLREIRQREFGCTALGPLRSVNVMALRPWIRIRVGVCRVWVGASGSTARTPWAQQHRCHRSPLLMLPIACPLVSSGGESRAQASAVCTTMFRCELQVEARLGLIVCFIIALRTATCKARGRKMGCHSSPPTRRLVVTTPVLTLRARALDGDETWR